MRIWIVLVSALLLFAGSALLAAEVEIGWQANFDDLSKIGGVMYLQRGPTQDSNGLIAKVTDGVLTFGAEVDKSAVPWDRAVLAWGKCMPYGFWQWPESEFKPIDVQRYPVLEVRARLNPGMDPNFCITPIFDTPSGISFTQMSMTLTNEWQTFSFRFSPLSSVPGPRIPTQVIGVILLVQPGSRASGLQIDYIHVRSFTPEERTEDDVIASHLKNYRPPVWKQPFFVYGPYGPSIHHTAWQGGFEGAYGGIVRAHMNYLMCAYDISYYRYQGYTEKTQEQNVADFIAVNKQAADAAASVGMHISLDIRGFHNDLKSHGLDYITPGVKQVADAFRNHPAVLGYTPGDEPQTNNLWEIVAVKELFEKDDPTKLVAFPLADALWAPDFDPYSTIHCGDRYPILSDSRNCEAVADQMDQYNKVTTKPVWFITQAIGDRPTWTQTRGGYRMPTDAEFLRMAFMAVGRGAKGLLIYDWYHTPWQDLTDRCGHPDALLPVASKLGERLAGVGSILLRCSAPKDATGTKQDGFEVCTLMMDKPTGALYVLSNTDLKNSRDLDLTLAQSADGRVAMDLETLQVFKDARVEASGVAPGDGRFFALIAPGDVASLKREILANRKKETARAAQPDRVIVRRWAGKGKEMKSLGSSLDACADTLMSLERSILVDDGKARPGKEAAWTRTVELGRSYDALRARWIAADHKGLADNVAELKRDIDVLSKESGGN